MAIVTAFQRLASAAAVFFGRHGAVAEQARERGVCRQALYREADRALDDLDGTAARAQVEQLRQRLVQLQARCEHLEARLAEAVVIDPDKQAHFAATAQAEGVSLPVARRLLGPLLEARTPSVAQLGRWSKAAAQKAAPVLGVLDEVSRPRAEQGTADEIFFGRKPCLMVVEQHSLCWLSGRLADKRDGEEWAKEFRQLPQLRQLTRDAGQGLAKGLALVNAERRAEGREPVADQEDHFHALREGGRALRRMQGRAARLLAKAEAAQRAADERWGCKSPGAVFMLLFCPGAASDRGRPPEWPFGAGVSPVVVASALRRPGPPADPAPASTSIADWAPAPCSPTPGRPDC
jgi:hypothetical protein